MLIEFSVGNYKSFRDIETFSMLATKTKAKVPEIDENNTFKVDNNISLLKSAAIYGANASGKSNLISALRFFRNFVIGSSRETQIEDIIPVENFRLDSKFDGKPSFFQIVFLLDGLQYRYGFEVDNNEVFSEWLFYVPKIKEVKLFERQKSEIKHSPKYFKEGKGISEKTRNNASFLSVVAQFNGKIAQQIIHWFTRLNLISGLDDIGLKKYTIKCLQSNQNRDEILSFVKRLDLGISDIKIEEKNLTEESFPSKMPKDLKNIIIKYNKKEDNVKTIHPKFDKNGKQIGEEEFDIDNNESEGTNKLFSLAGPVMDTLKSGKILFIDEFDARLHPLITYEIIKLFNSNKSNSKNAQIIFATHDTNLLSNKLFRRDQIWFAEKDRKGATHLFSLVEYKDSDYKIRNDASFENDYIKGRYGAIPYIGDLEQLFEEI